MSAPIVLVLRLLLAAALYAFLGWALLTLWRDSRIQGALLAARKTPGINLNIVMNDQDPLLRFFSQSEILLGRDPHCDVPLLHATISVRHARLSFHHGQWWLEDLNSTNGTRLNGDEVSIPTVVINGDMVECGKAAITISLGVDPSTPPTLRIPKPGDQKYQK